MVATALFIASLSTIAVSASTIPNNTVSDLWNLALDIETGKDNSTVQGGKAPEDVISMPEVFLENTIDIDSVSESDIVNLVNVKVPSEVKVMFDNRTVIETNTSVPESSTILDTTLANTKTTLSNEESTTKATEAPSSTVPTIKATPWTKPGSEDIVDNLIDIDSLDESDILDIVKNFIADKDPLLELYLSLCFLHPACYQLDLPTPQDEEAPPPPPLDSRQAKELWGHLKARRTESARNLLVGLIRQVQDSSKAMMFRHIQEGVAARGVSITATKQIIDSIKGVWESVDRDLEEAKSSAEELFYLLPLDTGAQWRSMVDMVGSLLALPAHLETLYDRAGREGYREYVESGSWNSWKRHY